MTVIESLNLIGLSLEDVREITTDPIVVDALETGDYRVQRDGVRKDIESKLLTVAHRDYPLRRVDGCDIPEAEARAISQRSFVPRQIGYAEKFCADDFKNTVLALLTRANLRQSDLTGTMLGSLVMSMTMTENKKHLEPMAWFADQTNADPQFNQINGYWNLINQAVTQNLATRVATYANVALTAGQGIQLMKDVIDNATDALDGVAATDKVFYIGRGLRNQLRDDLQNGLVGSTLYAQTIENGKMVERFDGIEIRVKHEWDALATSQKGYTAGQSNLCVLTKKQNLVWAINDTEDLSFEAFYSRDDMRYIIRNLFVFGVQIDYPTLISAAY